MSMSSPDKDLSSLIAIARKGTLRSRQILAENVLDLAISPEGRLSDRERALTDQVLTRLVKDMELQVRQQLAVKLSTSISAPAELIDMLAKDEISVAAPLLKNSKLLRDTTLIEIIQLRTREHQLCITLRESLTTMVTDALVEVAEPDVLEAMIRNPNAAISAAAMAHLVAESRRFDQFQEPLLSRSDLPANLAHKMFWWVSVKLRKKILKEFNIAEHDLDAALESSTLDVIADTARQGENNAAETAKDLAQALNDSDQLPVSTLIDLLRKQRIQAFCAGISCLAGISFASVNRIVLDNDIAPFAVLCKAIDISEAHFSTMALLLLESRDKKQQSAGDLRNVLDLFREISSDQAGIALRYWHSDSALQRSVLKKSL